MQLIKIKQKQPKKRKKKTCFQCIHSSAYDSSFDYKVMKGRCYCIKWQTVVQIGSARSCPFFESDKPVKFGKKKNRRRW